MDTEYCWGDCNVKFAAAYLFAIITHQISYHFILAVQTVDANSFSINGYAVSLEIFSNAFNVNWLITAGCALENVSMEEFSVLHFTLHKCIYLAPIIILCRKHNVLIYWGGEGWMYRNDVRVKRWRNKMLCADWNYNDFCFNIYQKSSAQFQRDII